MTYRPLESLLWSPKKDPAVDSLSLDGYSGSQSHGSGMNETHFGVSAEDVDTIVEQLMESSVGPVALNRCRQLSLTTLLSSRWGFLCPLSMGVALSLAQA